ncbi:MAG: serine/threonine protein kinase [Phormidesmis sp.]
MVAANAIDDTFVGQMLGDRYQVTALLGKQTGRRTLLTTDTQTGATVVVKLVLFGPDFTWEELTLFQREAETLKSLSHPAIPNYLDSFELRTPLGKGFALVQSYIQAKSLEAWVTEGRRFSESELQPIALSLLSILKYLHSHSPTVIHRDIKPSNILLSAATDTTPAKLFLIDFGAVQTAQIDGTMTIVGTYGYMPPEQFGGRAKPASDLYSLGATLLYLATGKHPTQLSQDSLKLEFSKLVRFSTSFSQWLTQLTHPDLSQRTSSAEQAIQQLRQPHRIQPFHRSAAAAQSHHRNPQVAPHMLPSHLSRGDFWLAATPDELEIRCLQSRIREPLRNKECMAYLIQNGLIPQYRMLDTNNKALSIGIYCGASLFFIFVLPLVGSIPYVGSLFLFTLLITFIGALIWLLLPTQWHPTAQLKNPPKASLKLSRQGNGSIVLSLQTLSSPANQTIPKSNYSG